MEPRSASKSRSSITQLVLPIHVNPAGNMHGGELMKMMDTAAGVVAYRHSSSNVVTVSVDKMVYKEPVFVGDLVTCEAELICTGRSSMDIIVKSKVEKLMEGIIKPALEAYFVFVALDSNGRPTPVPPLIIETPEQQRLFDEAKARHNKE